MNNSVVKISGIGKQYIRGGTEGQVYHTTLAAILRKLFRLERTGHYDANIFWALKDINLEIKRGEIFGIIGHNGAGKSTLLRIIAGITKPTTGTIQIKGRMAALLEVGTGFHQELTGRENIFMGAALMGMGRRDVVENFDKIVNFAGVNDFINTPIKRYSSGMQVRLAFSVAAHLKADVLFVDEVLSVGDAAFQEKCLGAIEDGVRDGRTVILVSHNMSTISRLCDRVVLLENGNIVKIGKPQEVIQQYLQGVQKDGSPDVSFKEEPDRPFQVTDLKITNPQNKAMIVHDQIESITLEIGLESRATQKLAISVNLLTSNGVEVSQSRFTEGKSGFLDIAVTAERLMVTFPGGLLNAGKYIFQVIVKSKTFDYSEKRHSPIFSVHLLSGMNGDPFMDKKGSGILRLPMIWKRKKTEALLS